MNWTIITGPLIGAVIGYFTNYLAVKMLFRPRYEIKLLGKKLPFTPGVIPKGKARLARVIGKTVVERLLTQEDMSRHLLSEEMKKAVTERVLTMAHDNIKKEIIEFFGMKEEKYREKREALCDVISFQIYDSVASMPIKEKVTSSMVNGVKEKLREMSEESIIGPMIEMMLTEERIVSLAEPIAGKISDYVENHGMDYIRPAVHGKLEQIEDATTAELLEMVNIGEASLRRFIEGLYVKTVRDNISSVLKHIDLAVLIENKINDMDVIELENMVLSVMKKELNTIVRLGALIGLIIGTLNIFLA